MSAAKQKRREQKNGTKNKIKQQQQRILSQRN